MSLSATCPACQSSFDLPDHLDGKEVSCSQCRHQFQAGTQVSTAPAEVVPISTGSGPTEVQPMPAAGSAPAGPSLERPGRFGRDYDDPQRYRQAEGFPVWLILVGAGLLVLILVGGLLVGGFFLFAYSVSASRQQAMAQAEMADQQMLRDEAAAKEATRVKEDRDLPRFRTAIVLPDEPSACRCVCWVGDDSFACLAGDNTLQVHRIEFGDTLSSKSRDLPNKSIWLALSAEGFAVTLKDDKNLRILSRETLDTVRNIEMPWQPGRVAVGNPNSIVAVVASQDEKHLALVDLQVGAIRAKYDEGDLGVAGFEANTVTPDGSCLLTLNQQHQLARLDLNEGTRLTFNEASQWHVEGSPGEIAVNRDSSLAAIPWTGPDDGPGAAFGDVAVVRIGNVQSLYFKCQRAGIYAVAFDPAGGRTFLGTRDGDLIVHSTDDNDAWRGDMTVHHVDGGRVRQLAMNPRGDRLLVRSDRQIAVLKREDRPFGR